VYVGRPAAAARSGHFFLRAHPVAQLAHLVLSKAREALVDFPVVDGDFGRRAVDQPGDLLFGAAEFMVALGEGGRARADMKLWLAVDALGLEAAAIDAHFQPRPLQRAIDLFFPRLPETLGAARLAGHRHAPAGLCGAVAEDDVRMRVVGIAGPVMDGWHASRIGRIEQFDDFAVILSNAGELFRDSATFSR
jgi:hypothetical protein